MTYDEISDLVDSRNRGFARGDADLIAASYSRHAVLDSPVTGISQGKEAIRRAHIQLLAALGPLDIGRDELLVEGDRAVFAFTARGTHSGEFLGLPPTGKQFTIRGVSIMTFEGHEIVHERRLHDFTGLLVNLGVLKERRAP